jgi:RNA polymerase sigma factor (sigma-70 family)
VKKLHLNQDNRLEKLLSDNYGLVVSQALFFKPKNKAILEEFIQVGTLAFLKAADNFNPEKGKFSTYISNCIHNAIFDFIKKNNKIQIMEINEQYESQQISDSIYDYLPTTLNELENNFIHLKLNGYSKKEIMELLNLTLHEFNTTFKNIKQKIIKANEN